MANPLLRSAFWMRIYSRGFKLQREALSTMVYEEWRIKAQSESLYQYLQYASPLKVKQKICIFLKIDFLRSVHKKIKTKNLCEEN